MINAHQPPPPYKGRLLFTPTLSGRRAAVLANCRRPRSFHGSTRPSPAAKSPSPPSPHSTLDCRLSTQIPFVLTPLGSTFPDQHRVLPCFGRNCLLATYLESTLMRPPRVTPLEATFTKNRGRGVSPLTRNPIRDFYPEGHRDRRISLHSSPRSPCTIATAALRCNNEGEPGNISAPSGV